MAFSDALIEEINEKNPIEEVVGSYVNLRRQGSNLFGLCPFHNEKTASFSVAPDKNIYYCFGCHKGGGPINFIMEIESLEYPDAVRFLAKRAGITIPEEDARQASTLRKKERLWALCRDAARWYHAMLKSAEGKTGLQYLLGRGLTAKTITAFGLGFAPDRWDGLKRAMLEKGYSEQELLEAGLIRSKRTQRKRQDGTTYESESTYDWFRNRVMFPIIDVRGNVIGFGGRVMDGSEPKYLNSPESMIFNKRKNLFALNLSKRSKMGMLVLTEGYMDTIAMHQYGFDCAVASLGTSLTQEQAGMLAKYTKEMVLCYDGDQAGQNAAKRAISILEPTGINVKVLRMEGAKDPDEYLKKYGPEKFKRLLGMSENQAAYQLETIRRKHDLTTDAGRVDFLKEASDFIASMQNAVEREVYAGRAAELAGIKADAVKVEVDRAYASRRRAQQKREEKKNLQPASQVQPSASGLKYTNVKSAMAEEGLLRQLFMEPALLTRVTGLKQEDFSSQLLGRVYDWVCQRWHADCGISVAAMDGVFSAEETAHIARILQKDAGIVNEQALQDYVKLIEKEAEKRNNQDIMVTWNRRRAEQP